MKENKFDITSTAIEKSIDVVRNFIERLLGSSLDETGLFISDNIKLRRFKNQIKIFSKAQKIVEENGINIKQISLKTLVPLLEYSSLEDNESVQDKWTNLIVNFTDSSKVYESSIFPFILNQISTNEIVELERIKNLDFIKTNELNLKSSEIANITRLGLIAIIGDSHSFLPNNKILLPEFTYSKITDLGIEFVNCCSY